MRRVESTPLSMVVAVFVTCIISATALTFTYEATRGRIEAQVRAAEERALRVALPDAVTFDVLEGGAVQRAAEVAGETPVVGIWRGVDADGAAAGLAVRCAPRGYGGPMQMIVGVDRDGKVAGVSIITQNETPGLGTKIMTEPTFLAQFAGWDAAAVENRARTYDAISGATKSSAGVRAGVVAAGKAAGVVGQAGADDKGGAGDE
ncbi:MAG: FMN-binding protein [Actinomycetota bacterium]|nr:FMN-binding protein [Actinomycetota bacterium]MDZ4177910.1 FMN-binding protein [Coriobacteriia bacterium]